MSASALAERAASADAALKAYMSRTSCDCDDCLADLLRDLMLRADKCGLGFEGELYRARCRYVTAAIQAGVI